MSEHHKHPKPHHDGAGGEKGKHVPLRDWTVQSYGIENGRAVSSLDSIGNMEGGARGKGRQIPTFKRGQTHNDPAKD